jgi:hypothetical protein
MFKPSKHDICLLIKLKDITSIESLISYDNDCHMFTQYNILSCFISMVETIPNVMSTVPVIDTTHDFILHNITWNKTFHVNDNICWDQMMIDHRLLKMKAYMHSYKEPLFVSEIVDKTRQLYTYNMMNTITDYVLYKVKPYTKTSPDCYCKFKHNTKMLQFVLENANDNCFILMNFLHKHSFISNDWETLAKHVRKDDLLVITNPEFTINTGSLSIQPKLIKVNLPPLYIKMEDKDSIDTIINEKIGFIPLIYYKAIKNDSIVVVFSSFVSTEKNEYTKRMIRAFHSLI